MPNSHQISKKGIFLAIFSYSCWGFLPAYWKLVKHVPSFEVVLHRICWAAVFAGILVTVWGKWTMLKRIATDFKSMRLCFLTGGTLSLNWFIYIWAVNSGFVLESSLGYFIVPLVNILFGVLFFKETLSPSQKIAVLLALIGVSYLTISLQALPWVALSLAITFGTYGLLCKKISLGVIERFTLETLCMAPFSLAGLIYLAKHGQYSFGDMGLGTAVLLAASGIITAIPLLTFGRATQLIKMSTMGFFQYLAPTFQFLLATLVYEETMHPAMVLAFLLIWSGLFLVSLDAWRKTRVQGSMDNVSYVK